MMDGTRYAVILTCQHLLLLADALLNAFVELFPVQDVVLLLIFVLQDLGILFALIVLFLLFFNTFIFQAGLVAILVNKFATTIGVTLLYLLLTVGLHAWTLRLRWGDMKADVWTDGLTAYYCVQKLFSLGYYYFYKRTALKMSDPRYYEDGPWLREQMANRK